MPSGQRLGAESVAADTIEPVADHLAEPYRQAMDNTERDHFATITTPAGSVVTMPFLTEQQADQIAAQYGPPAEPLPQLVEAAKGETESCGNCGGNGHWYENVEVDTPSGGKVVTKKRVNCRQCGGTGRVPK